MNIKRIDSYSDTRFSRKVLEQHGAFLCDGEPYEVEIISQREALIRGAVPDYYTAVIDEFRFFAEHISSFIDESGGAVAQFPQVKLFDVEIRDIQPSQFYIDEDKLCAVSNFIHSSEDVVIPLIRWEGRWLSLDGHTRMFAAHKKGIKIIKGFVSHSDVYIFDFAMEARSRGINSPMDMEVLDHEEYCIKWHKFCDDFFAAKEQD